MKANDNLSAGMENTRVLLVSPLPPPAGGIANWTKILLKEIERFPEIKIRHVKVTPRWRIRSSHTKISHVVYGTIRALLDIVKVTIAIISFRPQVLHLTSSAGYALMKDIVILSVARIFGVSGLIHFRTSQVAQYQIVRGWKFHLALVAMRLARLVLVLDETTYTNLQKISSLKNVKKFPNMIDLTKIDRILNEKRNAFSGRKKEENVHLVFIGMVYPEKGVFEQVLACTPIKGIHLHLVGVVGGSVQEKLTQLARHREDGRWLHFHGEVSNEEACCQILAGDIFLLPSQNVYEGFPNALLEAMALSKPVVVSNVGAMSEMIDALGANPCGVCVEPSNVESLRNGIKTLLDNPAIWSELGERGRRRVETLYSTRSVMRKLVAQWQDIGRTAGLNSIKGLPKYGPEVID